AGARRVRGAVRGPCRPRIWAQGMKPLPHKRVEGWKDGLGNARPRWGWRQHLAAGVREDLGGEMDTELPLGPAILHVVRHHHHEHHVGLVGEAGVAEVAQVVTRVRSRDAEIYHFMRARVPRVEKNLKQPRPGLILLDAVALRERIPERDDAEGPRRLGRRQARLAEPEGVQLDVDGELRPLDTTMFVWATPRLCVAEVEKCNQAVERSDREERAQECDRVSIKPRHLTFVR